MAITIKQVSSKDDLRRFIKFNVDLYKNNPYAAPDLYEDVINTLDPQKNAAFDFCEAAYFLACKDNKLVGRIAAIINKKANERWNLKSTRFGWIDFIDDYEVSEALIKAAEDWGREHGMTEIQGPLGFTDMDPEGMLIEGFDELSTMATIYNYPYYAKHMERLGFEKEADWVEFKLVVPENGIPERYQRIAEIVRKKYNLKVKKFTSRKQLAEQYGQDIFRLINESFSPLFGYSELSPRQIDQYVKMYIPLIDLRMITLITDAEDKLICVGISMPSFTRALQKAKGSLFPFGWYHLAKILFLKKYPDTLDLMLVAVKPEYQNKGVNALLFTDLIPVYMNLGFKYVETNVELESNNKVQAQWEYFERKQHKRRRCFKKSI
ncbi:MAG: N-acetyltransferase [Bacteroidales bacterium]|nr:N-acetyltransferase [Bacteroidales bacterium]